MSNIVNCTRNPAEVEFLKIEELIQLCLKIEVGERAGSASELLENAALSSLAAQLKNGISPNELLFGKNRVETIEMISEKVNRENKQMKDKNSELTEENSGLKREIEKLNHEIAELKKQQETESEPEESESDPDDGAVVSLGEKAGERKEYLASGFDEHQIEALFRHNYYRSFHPGTKPLKLSMELCRQAQASADQQAAMNVMGHVTDRKGAGENQFELSLDLAQLKSAQLNSPQLSST
jgi:uncharacterized phage infection (PIP) family protein YhgE